VKARPRSSGSIFHLLTLLQHPGPGSNSPTEGGRKREREGRKEGKKEEKKQGPLRTTTQGF